jgi:peptide-methionine (S)-S-oxide reductase
MRLAAVRAPSNGTSRRTRRKRRPRRGRARRGTGKAARELLPRSADAKIGRTAMETQRDGALEVATLAGGCFWCLEAVFLELDGVHTVRSGYSGGRVDRPTYRQVCSGTTGHAEVVQVAFDPAVLSFEDLLRVFFTIHDPTTRDRQGADVGTQYRSAIFYHSAEQRQAAERIIAELQADGVWKDPVVTEVTAFERFWPAEDYHDDYYRRNPDQPYCRVVIEPKVAKFRKQYLSRLKRAANR